MTVSREEMLALADKFERLRAAYKAHWLVKDCTAFKEFCFANSDQISAALRSQGGKAEPDAWLVGWHSANGDAGTSVYTTEDEARRAAKNMEAYRSSETMTDVLPLYAAPLPSPPGNARAEDIAIALCLVDGRDPDEEAPLSEMCDEANMPVPWWMTYTEYAEALLEKFTIARKSSALSRELLNPASEDRT